MTQKKILVIDDEFPVRYLVEHKLRGCDYDVHAAKDGAAGLKAAVAYQPDLIVLDVMMPGMDGFEVCRQIRNIPETSTTPVIFLTALMTQQYRQRAFDVGGDDFLVKPFQAEELLSQISSMLERSAKTKLPDGPAKGRVVSLYSPKGGVGTTTLAVQLSEAVAIHQDHPVLLIDLDLPLGGIAPMLNLMSRRHVLDLLRYPADAIDESLIKHYAQRYREDLFVVPAPGRLANIGGMPRAERLQAVLDVAANAGYLVLLDLGSTLSNLTLAAMRRSDVVYVITSGKSVANKLANAFMQSASNLGLESKRLLPVVNELHGAVTDISLERMPVARIPHATEQSRTKLWLRNQGMRKLVSVTM